jgi:hypothetical protein
MAGTIASSWLTPATAGNTSVRAIAYSPNFAGDRVLTAVTGDAANTYFEIASFSTQKWNNAAAFGAAYPKNILAVAPTAAGISLAPTYLGADETLRVAFVGVSTGAATGRLVRLVNTTQKTLVDGADYKVVAFNGTDLVAGRNDSNGVTLSANPTAADPTVTDTTGNQRPGGVNMTVVAWSGTNVVAGTSGASSAFAVSTDKGATFNDVSLIDAALTNLRDFAVSADGATIYLVSDDGVSSSVWRKTGTTWARILNPAFSAGYLVRLSPQSANNTYLFDTASTNLLASTDGGEKSWLLRSLVVNPVDAAVESAQVVYSLTAGGSVYKSTNGGFTWNDATNTGIGNGATITSVGTNQIIVGGTGGGIAWSTDGGASSTTWVRPATAPFTSGMVQATADNVTNGRIYAASSAAAGNVVRWQAGTSTSWSDIISGTVAGSATGIALNGGVLYVLANENSVTSNVSAISRTLIPTTASSTTVWSRLAAGSATAQVMLSRTPSALKSTTGPKLWAINDIATDALFSLTDTVATGATAIPVPTIPADAAAPQTNAVTGLTQDMTFSFPRLSESTNYTLEISLDAAFTQTIVSAAVNPVPSTSNPVVAIVSSDAVGSPTYPVVGSYNFQPGVTYYWRVKATTPLESPYSAVRNFTFTSVASVVAPFKILTPEIGATNVDVKPILSWTKDTGNTTAPLWYEVTMSEDPSFAIPEWSHNVNGLVYGVVDALKNNTTYYWRVRAVYKEPFVQGTAVITPAGPWMVGAFTTNAEPAKVTSTTPPAPPTTTTVTVPGPTTIQTVPVQGPVVQQPIPSWMLMTIIIIGAILVIALIVLIVRTRKTA